MIVRDIKVPVRYSEKELKKAIAKAGGPKPEKIREVTVLRRSVDARKKPDLYYVITALVNEKEPEYVPETVEVPENMKTVLIVGSGPAGLFAAWTLSEAGIPCRVIERGKPVEERVKDVDAFFNGASLDPESNVQFGEGGAGTFSDGKLNTLIKDSDHKGRRVLKIFHEAGAPENILVDAKPHLGTDILPGILKNIRTKLIERGVVFSFSTKLTDLLIENGKITGAVLSGPTGEEKTETDRVILAIGHSARDTYEMLLEKEIPMEQKAFAVGVRMEHPQDMITISQYGSLDYEELGAAPYKVTAHSSSGRGVYSFCMCPGGYVVNASSEPGHLAINGMSENARDSRNANSGIVVQIRPEDFGSDHVLAGLEYQRKLEKSAFDALMGKIPVQLYQDFKDNVTTEKTGEITPEMKGAYGFSNLRNVLPKEITDALLEAIPVFGRQIRGFDRGDAILSAVESRTSSPVRIPRNKDYQSSITGLYPAGEGAGYAGGIMSAAIDGIHTGEVIIREIRNRENTAL